jgi:hypothetical protein
VERLRNEEDGEILHRLPGRASKRPIAEAVQEKVVRLVKREYGDCDPAGRDGGGVSGREALYERLCSRSGEAKGQGAGTGEACGGR